MKSNKTHSQSAYNLTSNSREKRSSTNTTTQNGRSSSLYDLNKSENNTLRKDRRVSRSRELQNISEDMSTSENENHNKKTSRKYNATSELKSSKTSKHRGYSSSSDRAPARNSVDSYDEDQHQHHNRFVSLDRNKYRRGVGNRDESRERQSMSPMRSYERELTPSDHKKPPSGPPKPARDFQRRKEIERIHDSSGTEGESSQRSVVYLHATTGKEAFFCIYKKYFILF